MTRYLGSIDYVVVLVYLAITMGVGLWMVRSQKTGGLTSLPAAACLPGPWP